MKILFSHPGVGIFTLQAARALYEINYLDSYLTTFYRNPESIFQNTASRLGNKIKNNLSRREINEIPLSLVEGMPYYEILRVISSRLDKKGVITDKIYDLSIKKFDNWVAGNITTNYDAVYCYEYNSLNTLRAAKDKGLYTIYEIPSPEHNFVHNLLNNEIDKYPTLNTEYYRYTSSLLESRTLKRHREFELADLVLVNSNFTKSSFEKCGLDTSKIRVIPLGCPEPNSTQSEFMSSNKLRILWAGTFSIRKGGHYLLKSLDKLNNIDYELDIFGKVEINPSDFMSDINKINIKGTVSRNELLQNMASYDFLVFPTLCDGFGMVVTEALSMGLPVITTDKAGASDLIEDGVNGLVITSHSSDSLSKSIIWCNEHRDQLFNMRKKARESAKKWQWKHYRKELQNIIISSLENR